MRNVLDLRSYADWLGTKPADETYNEMNVRTCAMARYVRTLGGTPTDDGCGWLDANNERHKYPPDFRQVSLVYPTTFGAARSRAVALLRERA